MQTHSPAVSGQSPANIIPIRAGIAITPNAKRPSYQRALPKGIASLTAIRRQRQRDEIEREIEDAITAAHEHKEEQATRVKDDERAATINALINARLSAVNHRSKFFRSYAKTVDMTRWVIEEQHRIWERKRIAEKQARGSGLTEEQKARLLRLLDEEHAKEPPRAKRKLSPESVTELAKIISDAVDRLSRTPDGAS